MSLSGTKLAGSNADRGRVENDYYATNPLAVDMLIEKYHFTGNSFLEPCVGEGHIANTVKKNYPNANITSIDIVDRGYPNTIVTDFLNCNIDKKFDNIITNPPFSLAKEFIEKSLPMLKENGQMAIFLKIQFLEGAGREELFTKYPPKYIYVFRKRMGTWRNGFPVDENGKKLVTTMCHAWFIWEKGSTSEPVIRWL